MHTLGRLTKVSSTNKKITRATTTWDNIAVLPFYFMPGQMYAYFIYFISSFPNSEYKSDNHKIQTIMTLMYSIKGSHSCMHTMFFLAFWGCDTRASISLASGVLLLPAATQKKCKRKGLTGMWNGSTATLVIFSTCCFSKQRNAAPINFCNVNWRETSNIVKTNLRQQGKFFLRISASEKNYMKMNLDIFMHMHTVLWA